MKQDKKTLRRILQLLKDIDRNEYEGIVSNADLIIETSKSGNVLATDNQQAIINDVILLALII